MSITVILRVHKALIPIRKNVYDFISIFLELTHSFMINLKMYDVVAEQIEKFFKKSPISHKLFFIQVFQSIIHTKFSYKHNK